MMDLVKLLIPYIWLVVGIACMLFFIIMIFRALHSLKRDRVISHGVRKAYEYFKQILDQSKKGGDNE